MWVLQMFHASNHNPFRRISKTSGLLGTNSILLTEPLQCCISTFFINSWQHDFNKGEDMKMMFVEKIGEHEFHLRHLSLCRRFWQTSNTSWVWVEAVQFAVSLYALLRFSMIIFLSVDKQHRITVYTYIMSGISTSLNLCSLYLLAAKTPPSQTTVRNYLIYIQVCALLEIPCNCVRR